MVTFYKEFGSIDNHKVDNDDYQILMDSHKNIPQHLPLGYRDLKKDDLIR